MEAFLLSSSVKTMSSSKIVSVIVFGLIFTGAVCAADSLALIDESDQIYGKGVHAFFDRDYEEAVTILSKTEEIKNNDPRSYYFLGLAYLRQKKTEQADQYFKKAAQLEYSGRSLRDYAVPESLRRIQGEERLRIEKIRAEERTNARIREQRLQELRYGKENADAREALRQLSSQNQKENPAALQQTEDELGENAFDVKPIDPIGTTEDIVVKRTESRPFGGLEKIASVEPENTEPENTEPESVKPEVVPTPVAVQRTNNPAFARTERTFVNPDIPAVQPKEVIRPTENQTGSNTNFVRSVQSEAARQLGKTLGTMFSKKANAE